MNKTTTQEDPTTRVLDKWTEVKWELTLINGVTDVHVQRCRFSTCCVWFDVSAYDVTRSNVLIGLPLWKLLLCLDVQICVQMKCALHHKLHAHVKFFNFEALMFIFKNASLSFFICECVQFALYNKMPKYHQITFTTDPVLLMNFFFLLLNIDGTTHFE